MRATPLLLPGAVLLALAACSAPPSYTYGPASYATPPNMAPMPPPQPYAPPIVSAPLLPPPGTFLPDRPPPEPAPTLTPLEPDGGVAPSEIVPPLASSPALDPPAFVESPAPSDPVTDLLLAPSGQRSGVEPAVLSKKPSPPEANPMMGFRPMRGQTPPAL